MLWTGWAQPGHPQGDIDYPIFRDPERALCALNKAVREVGGRLVIKPHPSCKEWPRLKGNYPDLVFTESDLDILCKEADVIVTFLTKRSEEHTSELQSLMRISYAVFCLKKKKKQKYIKKTA